MRFYKKSVVKYPNNAGTALVGVHLKAVLKTCSKLTRKHPCQSVMLMKLLSIIEITLRHGCSPVDFLHIFGKAFSSNTYESLIP